MLSGNRWRRKADLTYESSMIWRHVCKPCQQKTIVLCVRPFLRCYKCKTRRAKYCLGKACLKRKKKTPVKIRQKFQLQTKVPGNYVLKRLASCLKSTPIDVCATGRFPHSDVCATGRFPHSDVYFTGRFPHRDV